MELYADAGQLKKLVCMTQSMMNRELKDVLQVSVSGIDDGTS